MKMIYIAGPYRAKSHYEIELNIRAAEVVAIKYWKLGYAVFCPHKNSAHFDGLAPDHIWLNGNIEILRRCDAVVLIKGWNTSQGTLKEVEVAKGLGIDIIVE